MVIYRPPLGLTLLVAHTIRCAFADPNDWVNIEYIMNRSTALDQSLTAKAQSVIASFASSSAKAGPWSVTNTKGVLPPSKDSHDFLSFAPYHWPNCEWCNTRGTNHLANPAGGANSTGSPPDPDSAPDNSDPYPDGGDDDTDDGDILGDSMGSSEDEEGQNNNGTTINRVMFNNVYIATLMPFAASANSTHHTPTSSGDTNRSWIHVVRTFIGLQQDASNSAASPVGNQMNSTTSDSQSHSQSLQHPVTPAVEYFASTDNPYMVSSSSSKASSPSHFWHQAFAHTSSTADYSNSPSPPPSISETESAGHTWHITVADVQLSTTVPLPTSVSAIMPDDSHSSDRVIEGGTPSLAQAPARTRNAKISCTPSPTSSMAPTATWTTCPYVSRDGQVNPDVRLLNGPEAINAVSQSILYNCIAYALQKKPTFSSTAATLINIFFLSPTSRMNPNMNFGQMVRGPGPSGQMGTFTGVLDLRGIVKTINGVMILKAAESPDWSPEYDEELTTWMAEYAAWLQNSPLGQASASRPNNHATFYVGQLAATRVLAGDRDGAADALQNFFSQQFMDQIAASGEQPFEAVRTRPYHYRCFNIEAMITLAKLGDQLGLDLWTMKSKYGSTIQTALDYTMILNPKTEDVTEILPHVAAISAAYGDPQERYSRFLQSHMSDYQSKSFWLYDQTEALPMSPAGQGAHNHGARSVESRQSALAADFECPAVFALTAQVEIDNGIYVTCEQLKPFYEIPPVVGLDPISA